MTWNSKSPDPYSINLNAQKDSQEAILARMSYFYPGSWLPDGLEQMQRCAEASGFRFIKTINGRLDYIQTLTGWSDATPNIWKLKNLPQTIKALAILGWHYLTDKGTRIMMESFNRSDQRVVFKRGIMSHERMFFEKTKNV
jgi:hypothetical protein